jgi:hypothetical protein
MPLKIVHIQFEEPSVPFDVASEIFSYAAYPLDEGKRVKFAEAACRWGHIWQSGKDPNWKHTPQLIRSRIFESFKTAFSSDLYAGMELVGRRLKVAVLVLFPHFKAYSTGNNAPKIGDHSPTVDNIVQYIIGQEGGNTVTSLSTFKSRSWSPTKPAAHLAFALHAQVYHNRINKLSGQKKAIREILSPYPHELVLRDVLDLAEKLSVRLKTC